MTRPATDPRPDLRSLDAPALSELLRTLGTERYRGDQVFRWIHARRAESFDEMTDLPADLRAKLAAETRLGALAVASEQVSRDGTRKLAFRTEDGRLIETVLIPDGDARESDELDEGDAESEGEEYRGGRRDVAAAAQYGREQRAALPRRPKLTQCISSQVGCALDCKFCATATLGFGRNLSSGEIVKQVYHAQSLLESLPPEDPMRRAGAGRVTNIVFMGMGEPLHNYDNVMRAAGLLMNQRGADLSRRRITISTAGLVPAIEKFGKQELRANLALSLNATTDAVRDEIMPINRKWNLARLLDSIRAFPLERRRRVTFEYVLLAGVNDSNADAERLPKLLRGIPSKVNIIPWNEHPAAPYKRPSDDRVREFVDRVRAGNLAVFVRRSRGDDIDAACGQLAAKSAPGDQSLVAASQLTATRAP